MTGKQRGSTLLGLMIGALIGLAVALGVAVYISKMPVPFTNKTPLHNSETDAAETMKNRNWNPNAPLAGKNLPKPNASASASGSLSNPDESQPPATAVPESAAKASKAAPAASGSTSAKLLKIWSLEPFADLKKPTASSAAEKSGKSGSSDPIGDLAKSRSADPLGDLVKARSAVPVTDLSKPATSDSASDLDKAGSTDLLGELAQARSKVPVETAKSAPVKPTKIAPTVSSGDTGKTPHSVTTSADTAKIRPALAPIPDVAADDFKYFVQAGAFKTPEDAEKQRAKLQGLAGMQAKVAGREQDGRMVYRVRIGPFKKKEEADKVRTKLDEHSIETTMFKRSVKATKPAG